MIEKLKIKTRTIRDETEAIANETYHNNLKNNIEYHYKNYDKNQKENHENYNNQVKD